MNSPYEIILLSQHSSNLDRTAKLVSGAIYKERDIYQVRGGYLICVGSSHCLAGLFNSPAEASRAVEIALSVPNSL